MSNNPIREIAYRVTGSFGTSSPGEVRLAYLLASDGSRGLVYHPESCSGGAACLEMVEQCGEQFGAQPLYQALAGDPNAYINLRGHQARFYRGLLDAAGFEIPRKLVLASAP